MGGKGRIGRMVTVAAILPLAACGRVRADSQTARVDKLFAEWNRADAPGCAVGVSRNGAIVYEHGYGMANLERHVPITPETVFPIASTSKSFTAMSVVLAAERGQLSLDDEVQKYIPEWLDRDDHITIRHLLTHTGGLRDAFTLLGWAPPSESAGDQNEGIVRMLSRQRGLNFKPGTRVRIQQRRLQPAREHPQARHGPVAARVLRREHLQAARHDALAFPRRSRDGRAESRVGLPEIRRRLA